MGQCPATFLSMDSCAPRSAYDKLSMWRRGHILGKRQCPCSMCSPNRRNDASVVAQTADVQSFARWEWCADGVGGGGRVEDQERETGVCVGGEGVVSSGGGVCERVCVRACARMCVCVGGGNSCGSERESLPTFLLAAGGDQINRSRETSGRGNIW